MEKRTSRFRKIDVCIWNDEKFHSLSPNGKLAFLYLITHPQMTSLGAMRASIEGLSCELGIDAEAFREVFREGMAKADWKARVVWIPKAINHNLPQSPNVVKSWEEELKLIPECPLKTEALQSIHAALEPLGASYLSVFDSITQGKPFAKPFAKPMPNQDQHQQQQQEQEQEQEENISAQAPDTHTAPPSAPRTEPATTATATAPPATASIPDEFEAFWREYPQRAGGNPKNQALKSWNARHKEGHSTDEILAGTRRYAAFCTATGKVGGEYVKQACTFLGPDKFFTEAWDLPTPTATKPPNGQRYPSNDPHEKHGRLVTGNNSAIEQWLNRDNPASPFTVTVIPTPVLEITHANH